MADAALATADMGDSLSPTAILIKQLQSMGLPPNAANMRRLVEANARNPDQAGPDPVAGLRNTSASTDSGPSVGQKGSAAKKIEGGSKSDSGDSNAPVDLGGNPYPSEPSPNPGGGKSATGPSTQASATAAPPGSTGDAPVSGMGDQHDWLTPTAIATMIAGAPMLAGGGQTNMGNMPMPPTGRVMDVPGPAIEGTAVPQITGDVPQPPSSMELAMQKAIQAPVAGAAPQLSLPSAGPQPADVMQAGKLPAGIDPMSVQTQPSGPSTTVLPENMPQNPPRVPIRPGRAGAVPMPGAGEGLGQMIIKMLPALRGMRP